MLANESSACLDIFSGSSLIQAARWFDPFHWPCQGRFNGSWLRFKWIICLLKRSLLCLCLWGGCVCSVRFPQRQCSMQWKLPWNLWNREKCLNWPSVELLNVCIKRTINKCWLHERPLECWMNQQILFIFLHKYSKAATLVISWLISWGGWI